MRTRISPYQIQRLKELGSTAQVTTYAEAQAEIARLLADVDPTQVWLRTWRTIAFQFRALGGELRIKLDQNGRTGYIRFQYPGQDWQTVGFYSPMQALHESDGVRLWQYAGGVV